MRVLSQKCLTGLISVKKFLNIPLNSPDIIFMEKRNDHSLKNKSGLLVSESNKTKPRNVVYIQLRSVRAVMLLVSCGVEVPQQDINQHLAPQIRDFHGNLYDSDPTIKNIMTIYSSDQEPRTNFLVKTYVNKHWFYIKDSDFNSKITFDALIQLLLLMSIGTAAQNGPALTLPVG